MNESNMWKETDEEILQQIPEKLLTWYDKNARVLPWREDPRPYRVWVSEIMLQQTRVEAVKPYFERFLKALPTVADLAQAPEEQLLKLWEGLGYYNRVRNLQRGARAVMVEHGGVIPASFEALKKLPGIGDYTAGAIGSIAFQIPVPAVDGNVLRVISRVLYRRDNILDAKVKRRIEGEIKEILPERTGDFNQSLMELGATVCLPNGAPKCNECPLQELCRAHLVGDEESLPVKTKAKKRKIEQRTVFLLVCDGKIALRKRPEKGLLAGLWELPSQEGMLGCAEAGKLLQTWGVRTLGELQKQTDAKHIFSHVEWHMTCWYVEAALDPDADVKELIWVSRKELDQDVALPAAFKTYRKVRKFYKIFLARKKAEFSAIFQCSGGFPEHLFICSLLDYPIDRKKKVRYSLIVLLS